MVGTETVMVVEDDEALRKLIVALLEAAGYQVREAANGGAALQLVRDRSEHIHLVLTDVLMPMMSGIDLSSQLRKLQPDLKVLLMSGYAGDLIARYRVAKGELMLIEKPFTRQGLLARIRTALQ